MGTTFSSFVSEYKVEIVFGFIMWLFVLAFIFYMLIRHTTIFGPKYNFINEETKEDANALADRIVVLVFVALIISLSIGWFLYSKNKHKKTDSLIPTDNLLKIIKEQKEIRKLVDTDIPAGIIKVQAQQAMDAYARKLQPTIGATRGGV